MAKYFNTEGVCLPQMHYMVNLDKRLAEIKKLVDQGKYFVINRGRQYGKTTTLFALDDYLQEDYTVAHLDFQQLSSSLYATEQTFTAAFVDIFQSSLERVGFSFGNTSSHSSASEQTLPANLKELFEHLSQFCGTAQKPVVLIIDEVDKASNYQVFIDFLTQLRFYYLNRVKTPTFQSVILAGVYDIKLLKLKIKSQGIVAQSPDLPQGEEPQHDSPWNIAAKFNVAMDFSPEDIESMLKEYEVEHQSEMDTAKIAQLIYDYTSGYPVLVSNICKELDEELLGTEQFPTLASVWTEAGVSQAVRLIVKGSAMVFESMVKYITQYPKLKDRLREILFQGREYSYSEDILPLKLGMMFGFIKEKEGRTQIANRMFEMRLYNFFLAEEEDSTCEARLRDKPQFIRGEKLDMKAVLENFAKHFSQVYAANDETFIEKQGRKLFLLFLRPIINGSGNYYIEAETRTGTRSDLIVDFRGERHVVEMKIWHGDEYQREGEEQLLGYLKEFNLNKGYLLTFSFNQGKKVKIEEKEFQGKTLVEVTV